MPDNETPPEILTQRLNSREIALRCLSISLALLLGGWLLCDGARAMIVGDYVTPRSGSHHGQLGPWARVVAAVGIEPRSTMMKTVHLVLGVGWLSALAGFALRQRWGRPVMLACAVFSLWYLPIGTLIGMVQIVLLQLQSLRAVPS